MEFTSEVLKSSQNLLQLDKQHYSIAYMLMHQKRLYINITLDHSA